MAIVIDSRTIRLKNRLIMRQYVCAPPGYTWTPVGVFREPKGYRSPSPEWTDHRSRAYEFCARTAQRIANMCGDSVTVEN